MKCRVCGGLRQQKRTDLPFKIGESTIVIVKGLPVVQCTQCSEYLISDPVMTEVEKMLASAKKRGVRNCPIRCLDLCDTTGERFLCRANSDR